MTEHKSKDTKETKPEPPVPAGARNLAVVHPLVLLSAVDHYNRVAKETSKRVVGVLLGSVHRGTVEVTNSYAVPFEEDANQPNIWFLDHDYHENMWAMFRKVNASERVIGWYSSGPKIKPADLEIHELFKRYCSNPVFVIIDPKPSEIGFPTKAYVSREEVTEDGQTANRFHHIPSIIGALEAEEVGVEHLLRDVKDTNISTLATRINDKILSLKSLISRLQEMHEYLVDLEEKKMPINHTIINQLQEIFNLLPNLNAPEIIKSFMVKTNDMMLVIYLASLIRSVTALHDLINNKLEFQSAEKRERDAEKGDTKEKEKTDEKDKDKDNKKEEPKEKEKEKKTDGGKKDKK